MFQFIDWSILFLAIACLCNSIAIVLHSKSNKK